MENNIHDILGALSAAIAPVFLLTGIGSLIASANNRYIRLIDRIRILLREGNKLYHLDVTATYVGLELSSLVKRARTLRIGLMFLALSVVMIVLTIFVIFGELIAGFNISLLIETCFLSSIFSLLLGVSFFIKDFASSLKSIERDIQIRADSYTLDIMKEENSKI